MKRRHVLKIGVGGGATLATGKAIHNVFLGYGTIGPGKNLRSQDLEEVAVERFSVPALFRGSIDGRTISISDDTLAVRTDDRSWSHLQIDESNRSKADGLDRDLSLDGRPMSQLVEDLSDLRDGQYSFEFSSVDDFFHRVRTSSPRPYTAEVLRGRRFQTVDPAVVEQFVGLSPIDSRALLEGLVHSFRKWTSYDIPRYLAGSIEDNVLARSVDLRQYFEPEVTYETLMERQGTGLFCWEFTFLAIMALHSRSATDQDLPLIGIWVHDLRHKHIYNAFASIIRDPDELIIPICFVDYTRTTLYHDLSLTRLLGDGFDAYDTSHRADRMFWDRY